MSLSVNQIKSQNNKIELNPSFVLIGCDQNMIDIITEKIQKIPTVTDVKLVSGMYEILVVLQSDSIHKIRQVITEKIKPLPGIKMSLALLGSDDHPTNLTYGSGMN